MPGVATSARANVVDDLSLVRRAQDGDHDAFAQLVGRHQDHVLAVARRMLPTHEDALDVSQEAFLKAYRGLKSFKTDASFSTWMHRIVLNACTSFHRKRNAAKRGNPISLHQPAGDDEGGELEVAGPTDRPEEEAAATEVRMAVAEAVCELDEEHREIIILRDLEGLSYDEVADALGLAPGTVRSRLHRARKELARRLEGQPVARDLRPSSQESEEDR